MEKKVDYGEPNKASKGEVLTRRAALKRVAAAFAGAGIVTVGAGLFGRVKLASAGETDVTGPGGHASYYVSSGGHTSTYLSTTYSSGS
jgi:hypothetical protein